MTFTYIPLVLSILLFDVHALYHIKCNVCSQLESETTTTARPSKIIETSATKKSIRLQIY